MRNCELSNARWDVFCPPLYHPKESIQSFNVFESDLSCHESVTAVELGSEQEIALFVSILARPSKPSRCHYCI